MDRPNGEIMRIELVYEEYDGLDKIIVDMDAVPRVGEVVCHVGIDPDLSVVRSVSWYPEWDEDGVRVIEPFAFIILGKPRWTACGGVSAQTMPETL
jgi:hypothetical protein